MIFTVSQVRAIREGKATAALVPISEPVRTGSLRLLRRCEVTAWTRRRPAAAGPAREVLSYIEARLDLDPTVEIVSDTAPNGDRTAVVLTVLAVRDLEVVTLGFPEARACGLRTPAALQASWRRDHPRADFARFVRFTLGDVRDVPRFVSAGWPDYTSDPSRAMLGEPEAISPRDTAIFAAMNGQSYLRGRADLAAKLSTRRLSQRLAAIEAAARDGGLDVRAELRIIEQRMQRAERRLAHTISLDEYI
jgi:hypothetical protein